MTAAKGAESFYSSLSNEVRKESKELAIHLDDSVIKVFVRHLRKAWLGHPALTIVDNSTGFDQKCNRVVEAILKRVGLQDQRFGENIKKHKYLLNPEFELVI